MLTLLCCRRLPRYVKPPAAIIESVCVSFPVTILPTALRAGVRTVTSGEASNSTNFGTTPDSNTVWILSLGPSVRYESAQQASPVKIVYININYNSINQYKVLL